MSWPLGGARSEQIYYIFHFENKGFKNIYSNWMGCGIVAWKAVKQIEVTLCLERIQQIVDISKITKIICLW